MLMLKNYKLAKCHLISFKFYVILHHFLFFVVSAEKRHDHRLEFFTEPTSVLVSGDGGRAVFKCSASPSSADIRWLFNGTPLYESSFEGIRISRHKLVIRLPKLINNTTTTTQHNALLSSSSSSSSHSSSSSITFQGGVFQCVAQLKSRAIVSQPAKLILAELKPFPNRDNISIVAIEGNIAVIPCTPPFSVPTAVTEFHFNNTIIEKSRDRFHIMPSGDLQIFNVREADSGIYKCIVHNPFLGEKKYANHHVHLSVAKQQSRHHHNHHHHHASHQQNKHQSRNTHEAAKFIVTPRAHVSAVMGSNVTLECVAEGIPTPNITWKKLDGPLPKWRHIQYGGNLILPSVRRGDEGTYVCIASNGSPASSINSSSILDIQEIPQIIRAPEDKHIVDGEEVTLECVTKGKPKPIISWLHNGQFIKPEEAHRVGISIKANGSKLIISKVNYSHSGVYQIFATNELGSTYVSVNVNVLNSPVNLQNQNAKDTPLNEEDEESDLISNNADGDLIDEEDDLFDRLPTPSRRRKNKNKGVKMVPPTRPEITRLSDDSVMVRWDVPQNDGLPILFFKVQFREMGNKGSEWNTVDEDIAPHIHSYAVNGLKAGSKYRFRIAAVYSNNDNKLGQNSIKFTLYKDPPMKKPVYGPTIIHAEPLSPSAISLRWEYLDIDSVAIEGFFIYYRATHTAGDYLKVTVLGANTRSHIISHLLPDTAYDMKMQCFNVAGTSDFSNIYTSKTIPSAETTREKGHKKENVENNNINGGMGPVRSDDDKTLYCVLGIAIGALALVFIVSIVLCILRHKQQTPRSNLQSGKMPKEKHPRANTNHHHNSHNHLFSHSNHNLFVHHRSNGHLSNTLAAAASNGYLARSNAIDDCPHQINIRVNPFCNDISNGSSLNRTNSINEVVKSISASHHHLSNNNDSEIPLSLNTMERRKMKRLDEHYPNLHTSNPRLNHHTSSFTRLNGTLERKRRSRTDLLNTNDLKDNETSISRCNGSVGTPLPATNGTLVIMQSSC